MKKVFENEKGDTNIVSLIVFIAVVVVAIIIFKPYIVQCVSWIQNLITG